MYILRFLILLSIFTSLCFGDTKIVLTEKEKEFIRNNPIITIGGGASFEPFIFETQDKKASGIDRDLANLIEKKTGLKIKFKIDQWDKVQHLAKIGKIDGLSSATITQDRKRIYNFTKSYLSYTAIAIVNRLNHSKIYKKEDTKDKKVAIQRGNVGFEKMAKSLKDVEIVYYDNMHEVLNAVVNNEVDFTILDESIYYVADKLGISDFIKTSFIVGTQNKIYFAFTKRKPLLISIFNKALNSINKNKIDEIKNKWFKVIDSNTIKLNEKEKEYLYSKSHINICINPNWYPFEKIEKDKYIGMSSDFFKLFEEQTNVKFRLIKTQNWSQSLDYIRKKRCDILPLAMKTAKRQSYLNFTKPYIQMPLVLATKKDVAFIQELKVLKDRKIGIVKDIAFNEILRKKYPELKIVNVKNTKDGLKKVEKGELFGFIGALASISYQFQNSMANDLKISGTFDDKWKFSVAIRKDDKTLLNIFEKLIGNINSEKRQEILNKYIAVKYEKSIDYDLIYKILGLSVFVILIILLSNRKIRQEKQKLDRLYKELKSKDKKLKEANKKLEEISITDKLTNIYNRRKIDEFLIKEIERSKRSSNVFSLIMIDIDYFKSVNDTYGHQAGDEVLCTISSIVKQNIREVDMFGRWGGEEFLIISPNTSGENTLKYIERIRKKIQDYKFKDMKQQTASFGITVYKKTDSADTILKRVDTALYRAKNAGRNRVIFMQDDI